jgi:hypothetical protein
VSQKEVAVMLRNRVISVVTALLALSASSFAQPSGISVDSSVSPEQIRDWLESGNSRLVAWGAYFASRSDDPANDDVYDTIMARRMSWWVAPSRNNHGVADEDKSFQVSREGMAAILDALIEKQVTVPALSVTPIITEFPAEALILASHLPPEEAAPLLEDWWEKRHEIQPIMTHPYSDPSVPYAFLTAMLLAKAPPPGFAASVLTESEERLSFWVLDNMFEAELNIKGGAPAGCHERDPPLTLPAEADAGIQRRQWPPQFRYHLQNSLSLKAGTLLVDVGGEQVNYRRISIWTRPTPCYQPLVSNDALHPILAEMLRMSDKTMPWPVHQDVIHLWKSNDAYLSALRKQIDSEESKFRAAIKALREKGYLTENEANTARPKLAVVVNDARARWSDSQGQDHSQPPLPTFVPHDPRISVTYDKR